VPRRRRTHPNYRVHKFLNHVMGVSVPAWIDPAIRATTNALLVVGATLLALLRFVDPTGQDVGPILQPILLSLNRHRLTIAFALLLLDLIGKFVLWVLRRTRRFDTGKMNAFLDDLVRILFPQPNLADHHYRATLFKVRHFWPFGSWLGAVARSGHTFTRKATILSIDANVMAHNTGFAGECWRRGEMVLSAEALPDQRHPDVSDQEREEYQEMGWMADLEYNAMSLRSRVFLAACVEVDRRNWGVLVVDSTDEATVPTPRTEKERRARAILDIAARAIAQLVS